MNICGVQDFESDHSLRAAVTDLLEEMVCNSSLLPAEHKAAASILRTISRDTTPDKPVDLNKLLTPTQVKRKYSQSHRNGQLQKCPFFQITTFFLHYEYQIEPKI